MKSVVVGTLCDVGCVVLLALYLFVCLAVPIALFFVCFMIFHWFTILLLPFIIFIPSAFADWVDNNMCGKQVSWVFSNSNCFYDCVKK